MAKDNLHKPPCYNNNRKIDRKKKIEKTVFNPSVSNQFTVYFVHFPLEEVSAVPHVFIGNKLS